MSKPPFRRKRVLVTYAWCRTAYVAVRSLARAGYEVFVCDESRRPMCKYSRFVSGFFQTPSLSLGGDYVSAVGGWCTDKGIDIIFPCHEDSIIFQKFKSLLPEGIHLACPKYDELIAVADKARFSARSEAAGVPTPKTFYIRNSSELDGMDFPEELSYVVKTRRGNGGKGVFFVAGGDGLKECYRKIVRDFSIAEDGLPIIQEVVNGGLYGACFLAHNGIVLYSLVERYIEFKDGAGGTSVFREMVCDKGIDESVRKFCEEVRWNGVGHMDFIKNPSSGVSYAIELNPRLWGGVGLSYRAGFDVPLCQLLASEGRQAEELLRCININPDIIRSRWLLGDFIRMLPELKRSPWSATKQLVSNILSTRGGTVWDDLFFDDPLPFVAQMADYWRRYRRSGGDLNPVDYLSLT